MKSNVEWKHWGREDPLYAVASWPGRNRAGTNPWTEADFFSTGDADWSDYLGQWERYGLDHACCVEIGCGAGRLTKFIADHFAAVHAVDVSEEQVALARRYVKSPAVTFHVTNGLTLPLPDAAASALISTFVFQHFDGPEIARDYLMEIARVMRPGASLMLQLPVYEPPAMRRLLRGLYGMQRWVGTLRANLRRYLMKRGIGRPMMRGLKYEIAWILETFPAIGFDDVELHIFPVHSDRTWHSFVFARKGRGADQEAAAR